MKIHKSINEGEKKMFLGKKFNQFAKPLLFIFGVAIWFFVIYFLYKIFNGEIDGSSLKSPERVYIIAFLLLVGIILIIIFKKISPKKFFNTYIRKGWKHYWYADCSRNRGVAIAGLILSLIVGFIIFMLATGKVSNTTILLLTLIFSDFLLLLGILYILLFKSMLVNYIYNIIESWVPSLIQDTVKDHAGGFIANIDSSIHSFVTENFVSFIVVWILGRIIVNILATYMRTNSSDDVSHMKENE